MSVKVTSAAKPSIFMPTHDQLVNTYRSITEGAEKAGKLVKLKGTPVGASKAPSYDITKKGQLGVGRTVYDIRGTLYLKTQVVAPNAKPTWYKVGPAPLF